MTIRNQELYETIKHLIIRVATSVLNSKLIDQDLIGIILLENMEQITAFNEFEKCSTVMLNDDKIRREFASRTKDKNGNPVESPGVNSIYRFWLMPLIGQYFRTLQDIKFDCEVYNSLYEKYERYMYSDTLQFLIRAPLSGFKCDIDSISIDEELVLRRMREEEIDILWKPRYPFDSSILDHMDALTLHFVLEIKHSYKKGTVPDTRHISKLFEGIVTAFRLFKSGTLDFYFTQQTSILWNPTGGITYAFKKRGSYFGLNYYLKENEIQSFLSFWKDFKKILVFNEYLNHNYLQIAISRFNLGSEEKHLENKLIDYFIAFEALYVLDRSELSYRLALRVATLIAESSKEKKDIFKFMRDSYTLRSSIIHGNPPKIRKKTIDMKQYLPKLENCLRRSIIKFFRLINKFKNQSDILDYIDSNIL